MSTNEILPFCGTDTGTNLLTQSAYNSSTLRTSGNAPGIASLELNNKALRQATFVASQVAQFISNKLNQDVLDNGSTATLQAQIVSAIGGLTVASKSASYSLNAVTDNVLLFTAVSTATLPTAVGNTGHVFYIINTTGGYSVTLATTSSQTIGGYASGALSLTAQNAMIAVVSDGSNWQIISSTPEVVTLPVTGGGTGQTTLTNHGLLVGAGTSAITQLAAAAAGTLLTGQGASSDPSFSATPTLGVAGTTLGTLSLAGNTSGTITIKPQAAAGTYNFNLPTTAGTTGQVLTSAGGGSSPMTWATPYASPLTTTGDLVYSSDNSGTPARLAIGSSSPSIQFLGVSSGLPAWTTFKGPTVQVLTSGTSATYTTPSGPRPVTLKIRMVGGGGGGQGITNGVGYVNGGTGGATSFNSITANAGSGQNGGNGGSGTASLRIGGAAGSGNNGVVNTGGMMGASTAFGGGGGGGAGNGGAGQSAPANSGAGGGGAGGNTTWGSVGCVSGGAGEYVEFYIQSPTTSYTYTVGGGGAGGAGTSAAGGNGGSGLIIVEEIYQ